MISRKFRNLHWVGAEASAGMDAGLAGSLATKLELQELALKEDIGSGGRFRQRPKWRGTETTNTLIDEAITRLRPELDEAVNDLFIGSKNPAAAV